MRLMTYFPTFRSKLFILFATSIFLPLTITSIILTHYFIGQFNHQSEGLLNNTLHSVSENIRVYVKDMRTLSLSLTHNPNIMNYYRFVDNTDSTANSLEGYLLSQTYRKATQEQLIFANEDILGIGFGSLHNQQQLYHVAARSSGVDVSEDYNYKAMNWYSEALKANGDFILISKNEVNYYAQNTSVISVARLVKDINTQKGFGILKIDANLEQLDSIFKAIDTGGNSVFALLDQHNSPIYTSDPIFSDLFKHSTGGDKITTSEDEFTIYTEEIPSTSWKLVYLSSQKDIIDQTKTIMYVTASVGILALIIAFIIFTLHSKRFTTPLHNIIETMQHVEKGNFSVQVPVNEASRDEFALISKQLNHTIEKVDTLIKSEYKAKLAQRNAEYLALQTQINPHFLYNTLNGFITLNRIGDKGTLEKSIIQLTDLFRYTASNANYLSTLGDEFHFLRQYLYLQKMRFEERLDFTIKLEENCNKLTIPKLLLQPLVENAIIHGMEPCAHNVLITVTAKIITLSESEKRLVIMVKDNGVGFNTSILQNSNRIGIANITERLSYFNKEASFQIDSIPNEMTICTIEIPLKEAN